MEVDKKDSYMLNINCKGKRTVGKAKKGINVEKIMIGFKIFLKRNKKKKKEEYSTELQKPNIKAEVYDNNKKRD